MKKLLLLFSLFYLTFPVKAWEVWCSDPHHPSVWVYAWDNSGNLTSKWPGNEMKKEADGLWYYEGYDGLGKPTGIIFSYAGTGQTPDFNFIDGGLYGYNNSDIESIEIPNSVKAIAPFAFSGCEKLTNIEIPNSVISIEEKAFDKCKSLKSIEIPNSVISIGNDAFWECTSLSSIKIPNSVTEIGDFAFFDCKSLKEIEVNWDNPLKISYFCFTLEQYDNAILSIPYEFWFNYLMSDWSAFKSIKANDKMFETVTDGTYDYKLITASGEAIVANKLANLREGVRQLDNFYQQLTEISVPSRIVADGNFFTVTGISGYAFNKCTNAKGKLVIPNGCKYIGRNAFDGCSGLTSVLFSSSVELCDELAFDNCTGLNNVEITDLAAWCNIEFKNYLNSNPLYYANHLYLNGEEIYELNVPTGVEEIKPGVFYGAESIQMINLPQTLKTIGSSSFGNTGISSFTVPSSVENWSGWALRDCKILKTVTFNQSETPLTLTGAKDLLTDVSLETLNLERDLILPDGISSGQTSLKNINLGGNITMINDGLFKGNSNLKEIVIPSSVTYIGESAFENCGLTSIAIGAGIEEIREKTFAGNTPSTIAVTAIESPIVANTAFSYINGKLMVTPGCEEDYYNNPNCWYQFNFPSPLVVATGVTVTSEENGEGNVKLLGSV